MWAALIPAVATILDKAIPDPKAKAEAQIKMMEMAQKGELAVLDADLKLALGQMEVNKVRRLLVGLQDCFTTLFRGGWRPAVGWVSLRCRVVLQLHRTTYFRGRG
jgi:hypothetical protein